MATNGVHIARLARERIAARLPAYDRGPAGIDEGGLADETARWLVAEHPDVIQADSLVMLREVVQAAVKRAVQATRPDAATIAAQAANPQITLPTFEEVSREVYRDAAGTAIALIEMRMRAVYEAMGAYEKLEQEVGLKRHRLAAIYAEMVRRGLADDDTVRKLYA